LVQQLKKYAAILGGRGMLGSDIFARCNELGIEAKVFDFPDFDITDAAQVQTVLKDADAVINCAAYTDVERAQAEPQKAELVNAAAVWKLVQVASETGLWVLHFGTDFVFDGTLDRAYNESDQTNPLNVYGRSKLLGEKNLEVSGCPSCIIRIEWTYGRHGNSNFVKKIVSAAQVRSELKVVEDQIGSPTPTTEIARLACDLLKTRPNGLFHFASSGYVSRFEMTKYLFTKLGLKTSVLPCKTSDYKSAAQRPLNSRFDCSKIQSLTGRQIVSWQKGLDKYLENI
jgi:dTDP-4-dehydrorhamnose reductase